MKFSYVIKGFIDPRRGDTIRFNFEGNVPIHKDKGAIGGSMNYIAIKRELTEAFPDLIERYDHGRERWVEADGVKFNGWSGNGPAPSYPCPEGECVELTINL